MQEYVLGEDTSRVLLKHLQLGDPGRDYVFQSARPRTRNAVYWNIPYLGDIKSWVPYPVLQTKTTTRANAHLGQKKLKPEKELLQKPANKPTSGMNTVPNLKQESTAFPQPGLPFSSDLAWKPFSSCSGHSSPQLVTQTKTPSCPQPPNACHSTYILTHIQTCKQTKHKKNYV